MPPPSCFCRLSRVQPSFTLGTDGGKQFLGEYTVLNNQLSTRPNAWGIRSVALAVAAGIALSLGAFAPATAATSDPATEDTIGISAEPMSTGADPVGRTRFSYQMSPGQNLEDSYLVTNSGSTPQTFTVFATDAFNTEEGGYGLLDTDVAPTDAGSWVRFAGETSTTLDLQPGETREVPFSVGVPADASPGDHAAGVVVSALANDGQVLVDRRVGTRLYVRVPGDLQPNLTIDGVSSSYTPSLNPLDGETTITFTVRNAGNVALSGDLKAEVKGLFGIGLSAAVDQEVDEMLPGSTRTITTSVSGVGQWVFLNPVVTVYPKVDPEALNPGPLVSVTRDAILFVVPWVLLAAVLLGLAVWGWIVFSRRRDARRAQAWIDYTEAEARRKAESDRESVTVPASGVPRAGS